MKTKQYLFALAITGALTFVACKKSDTGDDTNGSTTSQTSDPKALALKDFNEMYKASAVAGFSWNGNVSNCDPGTLSQDILNKALLRLKYFRKAAGLSNSGIVFIDSLNIKCQQNALMIKANNAISHTPPTTWSCYTAGGAQAAASGNIAYGTSDVNTIQQWIADAGSNNAKVGHRRWMLYSRANSFGFGATNTSGTLWVFGNSSPLNPMPTNTPSYVAWPPKGFIPRDVVYSRWSLSVPANGYPFPVDFTSATVTMTGANGVSVPLTIDYANPIENSYAGDNTIVWIPTGINLSSDADQKYSVKVANVMVNGVSKNYEYEVTIFKP
jgi:hypothetical protein